MPCHAPAKRKLENCASVCKGFPSNKSRPAFAQGMAQNDITTFDIEEKAG
jgi:hypothetical protein